MVKSGTFKAAPALMTVLTFLIGCAPQSLASTGGADLVEPLGWNSSTKQVYFRVVHFDESGEAPSILRLQLADPSSGQFETLTWSIHASEDSSYRSRTRRVVRALTPLHELLTTTVPENSRVIAVDTVETESYRWPRFRVRVCWFNGACEGWVEATTYRDPSLRMIRLYQVPGGTDLIGVFSYIGKPDESGYEVQVPILLPHHGDPVRVLEWWHPYK